MADMLMVLQLSCRAGNLSNLVSVGSEQMASGLFELHDSERPNNIRCKKGYQRRNTQGFPRDCAPARDRANARDDWPTRHPLFSSKKNHRHPKLRLNNWPLLTHAQGKAICLSASYGKPWHSPSPFPHSLPIRSGPHSHPSPYPFFHATPSRHVQHDDENPPLSPYPETATSSSSLLHPLSPTRCLDGSSC